MRRGAPGRRSKARRPAAGSAARLRAALRDARAAREALAAEREATARTVATVAHEVRTPLAGLLGLSALLLETPLDAEQTTFARAVRESGETLLALVDTVLDHARLEAGHIELKPAAFDPAALVEGLVEFLAPRAHEKGLALAARVRSGVPRLVVGDVARVRQIFLNVLANAVKFTEAGGAVAELAWDEGGPNDAGALVATVLDSGPGLPDGDIGRLFEPFARGAAPAPGTGLGLAIASRLAAAMGGSLRAASRPAAVTPRTNDEATCVLPGATRGAAFTIRLPLAIAEAAARSRPLEGLAVTVHSPSLLERDVLRARIRDLGGIASPLASARGRLIGGALPVAILDGALGRAEAGRLARRMRQDGVERVFVLLSPAERRRFGPLGRDASRRPFDGWLVKPVRTASLVARLAEHGPREAAQGRREAAPVERGTPLAGWCVLVAEDDDVNALLATARLARLGARVERAADGEVAQAALLASLAPGGVPYDLALMDVRLPRADGLSVTRALRAAEAAMGFGKQRLPVIALSANAREVDRAEAERAGMDGFLAKPLCPDALLSLLAVLARKAA